VTCALSVVLVRPAREPCPGIAVIAASSPQAKGRVERQHGTQQDRLVKKLRRKGIVSCEATPIYKLFYVLTIMDRCNLTSE
jgi:hypothetical protein